jgi:hypothetical protein
MTVKLRWNSHESIFMPPVARPKDLRKLPLYAMQSERTD